MNKLIYRLTGHSSREFVAENFEISKQFVSHFVNEFSVNFYERANVVNFYEGTYLRIPRYYINFNNIFLNNF